MILEPVDPNRHFRERRRKSRRRRRMRRTLLGLVVAVAAVGVAFVAGGRPDGGASTSDPVRKASAAKPSTQPAASRVLSGPRPAPLVIRGVHVTMALASIPGKVEEYFGMHGLNTVELDVKDENGEVGFISAGMPLAREIGAARPYYNPRKVVAQARRHGVFLIGRVVVFEDPVLASKRPDLAVRRSDGSTWLNHAGLGWGDPYNRAVWKHNVDVAVAAAKAGFDEIQFDYVRFPTDGDIEAMVFPAVRETPMGWVIAEFVHYAARRLKPLGVRVSADVFGLSATRDLGIGQVPRRVSRYLDAIYPMVYPSHYAAGEYNLDDPNAAPGETVAASLTHFRRELEGRKTALIPWLQDFSYGRTYTFEDVKAQIDAAYAAGTSGFLLWNPAGIYTAQALTYRPEGS